MHPPSSFGQLNQPESSGIHSPSTSASSSIRLKHLMRGRRIAALRVVNRLSRGERGGHAEHLTGHLSLSRHGVGSGAVCEAVALHVVGLAT